MAVSTALFFAVIYVLLDLISGSAIDWGGIAFEAVCTVYNIIRKETTKNRD